MTKDDLTAQLNAAVKDSSERHRDDVHRFGTGVPKPTVVESTRMSFEPEKFADEGLNPDDKFLTRNKLTDGGGLPLPGTGPTGCHCDSYESEPLLAKEADCFDTKRRHYCNRTLVTDFSSDGEELVLDIIRILNNAYIGECDPDEPLIDQPDWWYVPTEEQVLGWLEGMFDPPTGLTDPFTLRVVMAFECKRYYHKDMEHGPDIPCGDETSSEVWLLGICWSTTIPL